MRIHKISIFCRVSIYVFFAIFQPILFVPHIRDVSTRFGNLSEFLQLSVHVNGVSKFVQVVTTSWNTAEELLRTDKNTAIPWIASIWE